MSFPTDLEIAEQADIKHIREIAAKLDIKDDDLYYYGKHKAKIRSILLTKKRLKNLNLSL